MSVLEQLTRESTPDWLTAEMPAGYQNRVAEMRRLSEELRDLERCGRLLWQVGDALLDATREAFVSLGFEADATPASRGAVTVKLDTRRRLLIHVSSSKGVIQKKGSELAQVFQLLHEVAEDNDRVILVTNSDPQTRPADRIAALGPEALNLLQRLGANVLPGPTLFALWSVSLQDRERARSYVDWLHEQDGGTFVLPPTSVR